MRRPPLIGLTLDSESGGTYSRYPWLALRANYFTALEAAGALPIALPHLPSLTSAYLDRLDALVITGGAFDIDPALYNQSPHPSVTQKPARTAAETALLREALARDMPLLAICGGQQLLAVALGGTLHQHIPDCVPNALPHEQAPPHTTPAHKVSITEGTILHRIAGTTTIEVNSSHHQAVATPGQTTINATAPDGVIEGIELPTQKFCLGVQWHPEFLAHPADRALLKAFVATTQ